MLQAGYMTLVAGYKTCVAWIDFVSRSLTIECSMVERKRLEFIAFRELISTCEVTQSTMRLDFAGVTELRVGEESVTSVSC